MTLVNGETEFLIETLEDISKAYVLRWHIEETTQSRSRVRKFFWGKFRDKNFGRTWSLLSLHMCDAQGPWNPDQITEYRLNFSVLFGVETLSSACCAKRFSSPF